MTSNHILMSGAPEGFDASIVNNEAQQGGVIHVARDDKRLEAMRSALAFFAPDLVTITMPGWDCLPYDRVSPNPEIVARRMVSRRRGTIINTCSVTDNADKKCKKLVKEAKKISPDSYVAIIGCYAQLKPTEIAEIEGVDAVLGAAEKFRLLELLDGFAKEQDGRHIDYIFVKILFKK